MSIVVFNAGSSSLKFGLYDEDAAPQANGAIDWGDDPKRAELSVTREGAEPQRDQREIPDMHAAIACALDALAGTGALTGPAGIRGVGQRVVHGGTRFSQSARIDADVRAEIAQLAELAPLHNPPALAAIEAVEAALPGVAQFAVFDTAFYAQLPPVQVIYPVPYAWYERWGVRRFGFHGISHAYCSARAAEMLGGVTDPRVVTCHLGNGCSATATRAGVAIATTMGFTPMDGLMMGSRPGSLDPGILLYVQTKHGVAPTELDRVLNHEAGLQGVSGVSSDYRKVESAAREGDPRARLALDLYASRVREAVGALAVNLGGIDALVFTAGVGEHAAALRAAVCEGLQCLGLSLDLGKNAGVEMDTDVSARDSGGRILVIHTREELLIAREVRRLLL